MSSPLEDESLDVSSPSIRFANLRRIDDLPFFRILSMECFTNGCYASHPPARTHTHQLTHRSPFIRVPHQTLLHEVHKLSRPLRRRERRNTPDTNRLHHHCCSEAIKRILPLCQLNHRNAKRPHVTLQPCLILEDLRRIIPQRSTLIPPFGARVLHLLCQTKVAQLDQASFRNEQIVGFDVLSIHSLLY